MRVALAFALSFLAGCGSHSFKPESPHPSPERIAELLALPVSGRRVAPVEQAFEIRLTPSIILAGGSAWVACYVPASSTARRIRYGIEGLRTSEGPLERIENKMLVERISCGTWQVTCALSNGDRRSAELEARGECNADGDR